MPWDCLSGCISAYKKIGIRKPLNDPMIMPWVEVWFKDNANKKISVSNISSRNSKAVIKSFQFGMSNGTGVNLEIVDEEGGEFANFLCKITTGNLESGASKYQLQFRFGWATMDCNGVGRTFREAICCPRSTVDGNNSYSSCTHTMTVRSITANVSHGVFKFSVEAADMTMDMFTTRDYKVYGTSKGPIPLTQAIEEMFSQYNIDVEFRRQGTNSCDTEKMTFKLDAGGVTSIVGGLGGIGSIFGAVSNAAAVAAIMKEKGPIGVWSANGMNPIQAARSWLNRCVTERDKGIIWFWDLARDQPRPKLVFFESTVPNCNEVAENETYHLGTYIVNGGACSPVISFQPEIKFTMDQVMSGGTVGDATTTGAFNIEGPEPCLRGNPRHRNGFQMAQTGGSNQITRLPLEILKDNFLRNQRSNLLSVPISADLRVQGDPSFDTPVLLQGHFVSIVYINPMNIGKVGGPVPTFGETDFLANGCQKELSNTKWIVWKVFHEIKEGSFTTTLKVRLAAPGLEIGRDLPIGAAPGAPTICR
jgi:hypothetical protein